MPIEVVIIDPLSDKRSKIIDGGAIAVLPPQYNNIYNTKMDVVDTVFNIVPPSPDKYFVMNAILLTGNKNVGVTDATVSIYVATADDEALLATNTESFSLEIPKGAARELTSMNTRTVNKGAYVNGITDDNDVYVTILGYYTSE